MSLSVHRLLGHHHLRLHHWLLRHHLRLHHLLLGHHLRLHHIRLRCHHRRRSCCRCRCCGGRRLRSCRRCRRCRWLRSRRLQICRLRIHETVYHLFCDGYRQYLHDFAVDKSLDFHIEGNLYNSFFRIDYFSYLTLAAKINHIDLRGRDVDLLAEESRQRSRYRAHHLVHGFRHGAHVEVCQLFAGILTIAAHHKVSDNLCILSLNSEDIVTGYTHCAAYLYNEVRQGVVFFYHAQSIERNPGRGN